MWPDPTTAEASMPFTPILDADAGPTLVPLTLRPRPSSLSGGRVLAVIGAKGGCGSSVIAVNLAAEMARTRAVCLVDLEFSKGDVAGYLDLQPARSVHNALELGPRLDAESLRGCAARHSSGLQVLGQPYELVDLVRVDAAEVDRLLGVAAQAWGVVVADCGTSVDDALIATARRAHCVLLVVNANISALRDAMRMLGLLTAVGVDPEDVLVAVNSWQRGLGFDLSDIEQPLGVRAFTVFTEDINSCRSAENSGRLLRDVAPSARLTRDIRDATPRLLSFLDARTPTRSP